MPLLSLLSKEALLWHYTNGKVSVIFRVLHVCLPAAISLKLEVILCFASGSREVSVVFRVLHTSLPAAIFAVQII